MLKALALIILIFLSSNRTTCQQVYVSVAGSIGLNMFSRGIQRSTHQNSLGSFAASSSTFSFGEGNKLSLSFGVQLYGDFWVELESSIFQSNLVKENINRIQFTAEKISSGKVIHFFLPIGLTKKIYSRFNLNVGAGLIYGINPSVSTITIIRENLEITQTTRKYTGPNHWGVGCILGVSYKVISQFNISLNISPKLITFSPAESNITMYTVNGEDELSSLTTKEKVTLYVNQTFLQNNDDKPSISLPISLPFSSLDIKASISYFF